MKLSTKGRYGLRAMVDIAGNGGEGAVSISSIAQRQNLSESYLEQLMSLLRKAGIIESVRGAGGGYRLARPPPEYLGRRGAAGAGGGSQPCGMFGAAWGGESPAPRRIPV